MGLKYTYPIKFTSSELNFNSQDLRKWKCEVKWRKIQLVSKHMVLNAKSILSVLKPTYEERDLLPVQNVEVVLLCCQV